MDNQLAVSLVVDEEVQGYTEELHSVDELKEKVNALLDERVVEVRIAKKKDCQSNPKGDDEEIYRYDTYFCVSVVISLLSMFIAIVSLVLGN